MSSVISGVGTSEQEALDAFILSNGVGVSSLHSALDEAQKTVEKAHALWLGVLGHLVVAELIGSTVTKPGSTFKRQFPNQRFHAGILEFAPHPVSERNAQALWALRCSIGHIFGLSKEHPGKGPHFRFILRESGPFIRPALKTWDGKRTPVPYDDMRARRREATLVNVCKVYEYVERLVSNLIHHHERQNVRIRPGLSADQVLAFRQMFLGQV